MIKRTCIIEDCTTDIGKHGAKGYCPKHYKRYAKHGDAHKITRMPRGLGIEERLRFVGWDVTPSGCWEFKGNLDPDGYGVAYAEHSPQRAHRLAYEEWVGPIPRGHLVRHTCDNRPCINPDHLLTGLPKDNSQDAVDRKRMANGERHAMHKLTDTQVSAIRSDYATGSITQRALARKYGCSQAQVSNILLKRQRRSETHRLAA